MTEQDNVNRQKLLQILFESIKTLSPEETDEVFNYACKLKKDRGDKYGI